MFNHGERLIGKVYASWHHAKRRHVDTFGFREEPLPCRGNSKGGDYASKRGTGLGCLRELRMIDDVLHGIEDDTGSYRPKGRPRLDSLRWITGHGGPQRSCRKSSMKDWKKNKIRKQWMGVGVRKRCKG
ncbi:hypothetical protein KAR91_38560 [Candidatus Pacearchaeota archaeon]|nr:hypothetical protein [Candidatus Pacearchaeota archaeon]